MNRAQAVPSISSTLWTTKPTAKVSGTSVLRLATPPKVTNLRKSASDGSAYVDHPAFADPHIEAFLFDEEGDRIAASAIPFRWPSVTGQPSTGEEAPILSFSDEQRMFMRFNYARRQVAKILAAEPRSEAEFGLLRKWQQRVTEARTVLVHVNLRLVITMLKRVRFPRVDRNELISDGNIALLRCVELFDCSRGFKFSSYCCSAICNSFTQVALRASRYRGWFPVTFNPNMEYGADSDAPRIDVEGDWLEALKDVLDCNLAGLNDVERYVIQERFGLVCSGEPGKPKTLDGVGRLMGLTRERVRQIQNKALRKIKVILEVRYLAA